MRRVSAWNDCTSVVIRRLLRIIYVHDGFGAGGARSRLCGRSTGGHGTGHGLLIIHLGLAQCRSVPAGGLAINHCSTDVSDNAAESINCANTQVLHTLTPVTSKSAATRRWPDKCLRCLRTRRIVSVVYQDCCAIGPFPP